jgi:uncharacterized protein YndB with AHSA1/START domain
VFEAWITRESVKNWFVHEASVRWSSDPAIDARPGGHFSWSTVSNHNAQEIFSFHGTYTEFQRPERLSFSWDWQTLPIDGVRGPGNTIVIIQQESATKLVLTQTGLPTEAAREAHNNGWRRCFDGIAAFLSMQP